MFVEFMVSVTCFELSLNFFMGFYQNADFKGGLGQAYVPDSGLSVSLKQQNNRQVEGSLSLVQVYKGTDTCISTN